MNNTASERTAMDEWVALFATRNEMAVEYADLIVRNGAAWPGWLTLNLAIIDRWSDSALVYIKREAWKHVPSRRRVWHSVPPDGPKQ